MRDDGDPNDCTGKQSKCSKITRIQRSYSPNPYFFRPPSHSKEGVVSVLIAPLVLPPYVGVTSLISLQFLY